MEINFLALIAAAVSALVIGFVWYNPKVFGAAWMKAADMTEEKIKGGNMAKIFTLALFFAFLLAFALQFITIHQTGAMGMVGGAQAKRYHLMMPSWLTTGPPSEHSNTVLYMVLLPVFLLHYQL